MPQQPYYCKYCRKHTLHDKEVMSGGMGCLLTVITGGLFLPIWILYIMFCCVFVPYQCQTCGGAKR